MESPEEIGESIVSFKSLPQGQIGVEYGAIGPEHEDIPSCAGQLTIREYGPGVVVTSQFPTLLEPEDFGAYEFREQCVNQFRVFLRPQTS